MSLERRFSNWAPRRPQECRGIFQSIVFSFNLCVLFPQAANMLLGQTVIKLFIPNCLKHGSVRYLFWPMDAVKNYQGTKGAVNRESLGTPGIEYEIVLLVCDVASVDSDVSRQYTVFVSNRRNILLDISILEDGDSRLPRNNIAVRRIADKRCM